LRRGAQRLGKSAVASGVSRRESAAERRPASDTAYTLQANRAIQTRGREATAR
jgi:hypothetical protein